WIGQTGAGSRGQFPDNLREDLGALFVLRALAVHDILELRMAGHRGSRIRKVECRGRGARSGNQPILFGRGGLSGQYGSNTAHPELHSRPPFEYRTVIGVPAVGSAHADLRAPPRRVLD